MHRQLELGQIAYLSVLNAENTYQQARLALVQAEANRLADTAALFQALGGGWWHRRPVVAAPPNRSGQPLRRLSAGEPGEGLGQDS